MQKRPRHDTNQDGITTTFTGLRIRLAHLIRRIVGANHVEDIVQETFLKAYEAASRQPIRSPQAFMLTTARNLALNHIARAEHKLTDSVGSYEELDFYADGTSVAAEIDAESRERFVAFCRAVQRLPRDCRRVFVLKRVYGLSQKEIAARLGITENTVEKQAGKGLALVAEHMAAMGHPVGKAAVRPMRPRRDGRSA